MTAAGGVMHRIQGKGAGLAERRARRPAPEGRRSFEWVPAAVLVVLAAAAALLALRAGMDAVGTVKGSQEGTPAGDDADWNLHGLAAVVLPWAIPLVIGATGLADTTFAGRRGAVAGVLLIGLAGTVVTSLLDPLTEAVGSSGGARWLGLAYLLRFGFAVQVLAGLALWIQLAPVRHRTALNAAFAGTVAAALPLLFVLAGDDLLRPMWGHGTGPQTWLPPLALCYALLLVPTGRLLVPGGQGRIRAGGMSALVAALGVAGLVVSLITLFLGSDTPRPLALWPVVALGGCLVAAGATHRIDGIRSVAGALLAMAVGLAALPAALFGWDRSADNPGLALDGPSEHVPWIAALALAGIAGAAAARALGPGAVAPAAVALVLAEVVGPSSGTGHQIAVRCAGAAALGVVVAGLRPEPALAAFGLGTACGPVWPQLQKAEAEYGWIGALTAKPGGVPLPLLVLSAVALLLAVAGAMAGRSGNPGTPRGGSVPGPPSVRFAGPADTGGTGFMESRAAHFGPGGLGPGPRRADLRRPDDGDDGGP